MEIGHIKVKCYEGYRAEERPLEFQLGEQLLTVQAVLDRWQEPDSTYYKLKASDGNVYILKQSFEGGWTLISFRREAVH